MNKIKIVLISALTILFAGVNAQQSSTKAESSPKVVTGKTAAVHLTSATFKQKVFDYEKSTQWKFAGERPCIIDFYADWCGPCRMVAPTVEQIAKEFKGKVDVYKVNVDEERELAGAFGIQSIPAILFCPKTDQPQMAAGVISKDGFLKAIKEVLKVQ